MEKEFVPYELAVKLKELDFDEPCLANYVSGTYGFEKVVNTLEIWNDVNVVILHSKIKAPLWQQAFDWFREKHNLFSVIDITIESEYFFYIYNLADKRNAEIPPMEETYYNNYEQARQACLERLIELCQQN